MRNKIIIVILLIICLSACGKTKNVVTNSNVVGWWLLVNINIDEQEYKQDVIDESYRFIRFKDNGKGEAFSADMQKETKFTYTDNEISIDDFTIEYELTDELLKIKTADLVYEYQRVDD